MSKFDDVNVSSMMENLYGPSATQMMGGKKPQKIIKKIKKGGASEKYEIVMYPEYIENKDFILFVKSFYLVKHICHSYSACIYVIPEHDVLVKMIDSFKKELEKNKIKEKTVEAYKYTMEHPLEYKHYIFNVFGNADREHYRLDAEVPAYKDFGIVKRTNLLNEQYYFKYIDQTTIKVCPKADSETGATKLKLIAKCANGIYVFQGAIPAAKEKYERKISGKVAAFVGGAAKSASTLAKINKLNAFIKKYGESMGSEYFISSCALAENNIPKYANIFGGDLLHSAFRICYNPKFGVCPKNKYSTKKIRETTKKIIKSYKPTFAKSKKNPKELKELYAKIVLNNMSPIQSTQKYLSELHKFYNSNDIMYADISVNMYRNSMENDLKQIYNLIHEVQAAENGHFNSSASDLHFEYSNNSNKTFKTSKMCSYINEAISSAPFVGLNSASYIPNLMSIDLNHNVFIGGDFEDESESDTEEFNEDLESEDEESEQENEEEKKKKIEQKPEDKEQELEEQDQEEQEEEEEPEEEEQEDEDEDEEPEELTGGAKSKSKSKSKSKAKTAKASQVNLLDFI